MQAQKPSITGIFDREMPDGARYIVKLDGEKSEVARVYPIEVSREQRRTIRWNGVVSYKANGFDVRLQAGDAHQQRTITEVSGEKVNIYLGVEDQHPSKTVEVNLGTSKLEIDYQK